MACKISSWYGRFGNNIIQLSKALYYCETNDLRELIFPRHPMLKTTRIILEHNKGVSNTVDVFYHTDCDASFDELRSVSLKYLPYILNLQIEQKDLIVGHIRGGDIFNSNPHPNYIPPPLDYYTSLNPDIIISEDNKNPCVAMLPNIQRDTLTKDLETLLSAREIVAGNSTFSLIPFFVSKHLEKIHVPRELVDHMKRATKLLPSEMFTIYHFPGYISGRWSNTKEQRDLILSYKMRRPTLD